MPDTRLVEVFRNGDPEVPAVLVLHREGAREYDHVSLPAAETAETALALLRSLPPEQWERAVKQAVFEHDDFVGERFIAGLRSAPH